MSNTSIPEKVKLQLVARAAGRCQYRGCAKMLDTDDLTGRSGRYSHFAHIVADSPAGPRGDATRSALLADDVDNLMLLCFDHHRLIDQDDVDGHPEPLLLEHKHEHEDRIKHLLSLDVSHRTKLLIVKVPIGARGAAIDLRTAQLAVLPRYPLRQPVDIDLTNLTFRDDDDTFWSVLPVELQRQIERGLTRAHDEADWHSVSVFALAPIPLLLQLGRVLGDIRTVHVHQKLRTPDTWAWQDPTPDDATFSLIAPPTRTTCQAVGLALSISGVVQGNEIEAIAAGADRWEVRASAPAVDVVRTRAQLEAVGELWRQALSAIRTQYGSEVSVHLFPAIPNSVAVELGRRLLPKADPVVHVYDHQPGGFVHRGTLNPRPS